MFLDGIFRRAPLTFHHCRRDLSRPVTRNFVCPSLFFIVADVRDSLVFVFLPFAVPAVGGTVAASAGMVLCLSPFFHPSFVVVSASCSSALLVLLLVLLLFI